MCANTANFKKHLRSLDCFALGRTRDEASLGPFLGTSSFYLTGKKIPNVVGFGTFPNVVGPPSLRTVSRIEAVLPGVPSMGALLSAPDMELCLLAAPWLQPCLGFPLGCALACSLDCFALGRAWGESSLGPFFGNVVILHNGKEDS